MAQKYQKYLAQYVKHGYFPEKLDEKTGKTKMRKVVLTVKMLEGPLDEQEVVFWGLLGSEKQIERVKRACAAFGISHNEDLTSFSEVATKRKAKVTIQADRLNPEGFVVGFVNDNDARPKPSIAPLSAA